MSCRPARELALGIVLMVIAAVVYFVVIPHGIQSLGSEDVAALAPDFWPRVITVMMALAGAWIAFKGGRELFGCTAKALPVADNGKLRYSFWEAAVRAVAAIAVLFGYYGLIPWLGLPIASSLVLLVLLLMGEGRISPLMLVLVSVLLPVLLALFFLYAAQVAIPLGPLEGLLQGVY